MLAIERGHGRSVVTRASARSPLQVSLPRNHGHAVWAFLASLVDGDDTALNVTVGECAAVLLTTQASTKVYRCHGGPDQAPGGCRRAR